MDITTASSVMADNTNTHSPPPFRSIFPGVAVALLLTLFAAAPLTMPGYPWNPEHQDPLLTIQSELNTTIRQGQLIPRWFPNLFQGAGAPVPSRSMILPHAMAAILQFIGVGVVAQLKILAAVLILAGSMGMFLCGCRLGGSWLGVLAAAAYVYAPFRAGQLMLFGDIQGYAASAVFPWALHAFLRLLDAPRKPVMTGAFLTGLLAAMDFTGVIAAFILPLSAFFLSPVTINAKNLRRSLLVLTLGLALSAVFWLPPVCSIHDFSVPASRLDSNSLWDHLLYPSQWFSYSWGTGDSVPGPDDNAPFQVGLLQWALFFMVLAGFHRRLSRPGIWGITGLILVFLGLLSPLSTSVWKAAPLLWPVTAPWRLLWIPIALATLTGSLVVTAVAGRFRPWLAVISAVIGIHLGGGFYLPFGHRDLDISRFSPDMLVTVPPEPWMSKYLPRDAKLTRQAAHHRLDIAHGTGTVIRYRKDIGHCLAFQSDGATALTFNCNLFDFPGWQVTVDGRGVPHSTDDSGRILFQVPAGTHDARVYFGNPPGMLPGKTAGLAACLILAGWGIIGLRRRIAHED